MDPRSHGGSGPGIEMAIESAWGLPCGRGRKEAWWEEGARAGECGVGERLGEEQGWDAEGDCRGERRISGR
jgi:hypothetical protein